MRRGSLSGSVMGMDLMVRSQLAEGRTFASHSETLEYIASQGFRTIPHKVMADHRRAAHGTDLGKTVGLGVLGPEILEDRVGQKAGKILAARFGSFDALAQATEEELENGRARCSRAGGP